MAEKEKNYKQGFTLLELLVVVLIIGILASIALPQYRKAVGRAELAQVISATKAITNAQERFYLTNGSYTTNLQSLDIGWTNDTVTCYLTKNYSTCVNGNYGIVHYYSQSSNNKNYTECYSKTKRLSNACKNWLRANPSENNDYICLDKFHVSTCWAVYNVKMPM